jgi:hypothetical protein
LEPTQQTISGTGVFTDGTVGRILSLTIDNTSGASPAVDLQCDLAIATNNAFLTLTNGEFGSSTGNRFSIGAGAAAIVTLNRANGFISINPTWNLPNVTLNINYTNSTADINTGNEMPGTAIGNINNVVVNNTTSNVILTNADITLTGALTLTNGIFDMQGNTMKFVTANTPLFRTNGTLTTTNASVLYFGIATNKAGNTPIVPANFFTNNPTELNDLFIYKTAAAQGLTWNNQDLTINGTLYLDVAGSLTLVANTTLTFQNDDTPINKVVGAITTLATNNIVFGTAGNKGGAAFTIPAGTFLPAAQSLTSLTINRDNKLTWNEQNLTLSGSLTLHDGEFDLNGVSFTTTATTPFVTNGGTLTPGATASFIFNANASDCVIPDNLFTATPSIASFTMNRGAGRKVTLGNQAITTTTLTLTAGTGGILEILNSDFEFSTLLGTPSANSLVVTNGTGFLRKYFNSGSTAASTFPIGDNTGTIEYSPFSITFATNAVAGSLGVKCTDAIHPSLPVTIVDNYITRYWSFDAPALTTYSYSSTLSYPTADVVGLDEANFKMNRYDAGTTLWTGDNSSNTVVGATSNLTTSVLSESSGKLHNNSFTSYTPEFSNGPFYSQGSANFSSLVNWNTIPGGGGISAAPANLTSGLCEFFVQDGHTVTVDQNITVKDITVGGGASGVLTIGNSAVARTISVERNFIVAAGGTANVGAFATTHLMTINGDLTINGTFDMYRAAGQVCNVTFATDVAHAINGTPTSVQFNNLTFGATSNTTTASYALDIEGALTLSASSEFNSGAFTHTVGNAWVGNATGTHTSTGTILFDGDAQTITGPTDFYNVEFAGTGIKTINTGIIAVGNDFNITANNLTITSNQIINIARDLNISGNTALLTPTAVLNIARDMNISGTITTLGGNANTTTVTRNLLVSNNSTFTIGSAAAVKTINVNGDVQVNAGSTINVGAFATTHSLTMNGNLLVNGNFDMVNLFPTQVCNVTFAGNTDNTISGTGVTCNFNIITVNKGVANTLEATREITMSTPTAAGRFLNLVNGTFKLSSASTLTPYYGNATICDANSKLWLNNVGANVKSFEAGVGTTSGVATFNGTLQVTSGTFEYGSGDDYHTLTAATSELIIDGSDGTVKLYGGLNNNSATAKLTISDGNLIIDCQRFDVGGNNFTANDHLVDLRGVVNFTGGKLTIVDPTAYTTVDNQSTLLLWGLDATDNLTGSTIQFGDGVSTTGGGSARGFSFRSNLPSTCPIGNIIINNTTGSNRHVLLHDGPYYVGGDLTIFSGDANDLRVNGRSLFLGGHLTNEGTFTTNVANSLLTMNGSNPQVISGAGTFNDGTVGRILNLTIDNAAGVDLQCDLGLATTTGSLSLLNGEFGSSGGNIYSIGAGVAATLTINRSNGSMSPLLVPTWNLPNVTLNMNYTTATAPITTGNEMPSTGDGIINNLVINSANGVLLGNADITIQGNTVLTNGAFNVQGNTINFVTNAAPFTGSTAGTLTTTNNSNLNFGNAAIPGGNTVAILNNIFTNNPTVLNNLSIHKTTANQGLNWNNQSLTINGTLTLNMAGTGTFNIGANNTLTFQNGDTPIDKTLGTITTAASNSLVFGTAGNTAGAAFVIPDNTFMPALTQTLTAFTVNRDNLLTWNAQNISLSGSLTLEAGEFDMNGVTFTSNAPTPFARTTGTLTPGATASFVFNGNASDCSIPNDFFTVAPTISNITMNRGAGWKVAMGNQAITTTTLNLTNNTGGLLEINNADLEFTTLAGTPSANSMVVTNGTGYLKKYFNTGATPAFTFPVGDNNGTNEYSPYRITFTANSDAGTVGVKCTNAMHPANVEASYINRYWSIDAPALIGTYSYSALMTYPVADVVGTESTLKMHCYDNGLTTWVPDFASTTNAVAHTVTTSALNETSGKLHNNDFTSIAPAIYAHIFYSQGSGSFSTTSNWDENPAGGGIDAIPGDLTSGLSTFIIQDGHTITLDQNISVDNLTVGTGASGILTIGNIATARTINVEGDFTVANGATANVGAFNALHQMNIKGDLVLNSGSFNMYTAANQVCNVTMLGAAAQAISGTPTLARLNNLSIGSTSITTASCDLDINGNVVIGVGTEFISGANSHTVAGNWTNSGTYTHSSGTITLDGGNQAITSGGSNFNHLTCNGTNTKTLVDAITIDGDLAIGGTATLNDAGFQITGNATGTFVMGAATGLTLGDVVTATTFPTGFTNALTNLNSTSTVRYNSDLNQTVSSIPSTYGHLILTSAGGTPTKTADGNISVAGNLTINADNNFADAGNTISCSNAITVNGTHTGAGKIQMVDAVNNQTLSGAGSITNFEIAKTGGVLGRINSDFIINGDITLTSGNFSLNTYDLTSSGDIDISNGTTFTVNNNAVLYVADTKVITNAGNLNFVGAAGFPATITINGAGTFHIVQSVGTGAFGATYADFSNCDITLSNGTITANDFNYCSFSNGTGLNEYINLNGFANPISATVVSFNAGATNNITNTAGPGVITISGYFGTLSGSAFENDIPANGDATGNIRWSSGNTYYSQGINNFSVLTNWNTDPAGLGANPIAAELTSGVCSFIVQDGHTITINQNIDVTDLTVGTGTSGILTFDATARTVNVRNNLTVADGGTMITGAGGVHPIFLYGDLTVNGTFDLFNGGVANVSFFKTSTQLVNGTPTLVQFNNIVVGSNSVTTSSYGIDIQGTLTLNANSTLTLGGASNIEGLVSLGANTAFNTGAFTHTLAGNWTGNATGTHTSTGAIRFDGANQTVSGPTAFYNAEFAGTGIKTINGGIISVGNDFNITANNLTINPSVAVNITRDLNNTGTTTTWGGNANTTTISGKLLVSNNSTLTLCNIAGQAKTINTVNAQVDLGSTLNVGAFATNNLMSISGDLTVNGTFDMFTAAGQICNVTFNGAGAQSLLGTPTIAQFNNLTFAATTNTTSAFAIDVEGNVILGAGTTFNSGASTHTVAGNWTGNATGTHTSTGTVIFDGVAQTVAGPTSFNNIEFAGSGVKTINGGIITVGNDFNVTANNLTVNSNQVINIARDYNVSGNTALLTPSAAINITRDFNNTGTPTVYGGNANTTNISGKLLVSNNSTFTMCNIAGQWKAFNIVNAQVDLGSTLNVGAFATTNVMNISGDLTVNGDFDMFTAAGQICNVTFNGAGAQFISGTPTLAQFNNVTFGGTTNSTSAFAFDVEGNVALGAGTTFNSGASTHTVAGNWTGNATGTHSSTGTVLFDGAAQTIVGPTNFYNVELAGTGVKTINTNTVTVGNDFNVTANNLTVTSNQVINITGDYNVSGTTTLLTPTAAVNITGDMNITGNPTVLGGNANTTNITGKLFISNTSEFTLCNTAGQAKTLNITGDVEVEAASTLNVGAFATTNLMSIGGNLIVDGDFDMFRAATQLCNVTFTGVANTSISGTGATCDFNSITVNKGVNATSILDVTRVITMQTPTAGNYLNLTNGTFKLSSASDITPYYGSVTISNPTAKLHIDNAGAIVRSAGLNGTVYAYTLNGEMQISAGELNLGAGNDALNLATATSILTVDGGTLNMNGNIAFTNSSQFNMTSGAINIDVQTAAENLVAGTSTLNFSSTNAVNAVTFTGGTITIIDPHVASGGGYALYLTNNAGYAYNFAGGTIQFGNGVSNTAGSADGFDVYAGGVYSLGNITLNNGVAGSQRYIRLYATNCLIDGNLTISGVNDVFYSHDGTNGRTVSIKGNLVNNGTYHTGVPNCILNMNGTLAQTISGAGTFTDVTTTGRILALTINNTAGVDLQCPLAIASNNSALTLTNGALSASGAGALTLGAGLVATVTTTRTNGSLTLTPTWNLTGVNYNLVYNNAGVAITTGNEVPATADGNINNITINNATGVNLNTASVTTTGTFTFSTGLFNLGANSLYLGAAAVFAGVPDATKMITTDGTGMLYKYFATGNTAAFTFPIGETTGTTEYSPATIDFSANTVAGYLGTRVVDAKHPANDNIDNFVSRYWKYSASDLSGTYTYVSTHSYPAADVVASVPADEANFALLRYDNGTLTWTTTAGSVSNAVAHTITSGALNETTGKLDGNDYASLIWSSSSLVYYSQGVGVFNNTANWNKLPGGGGAMPTAGDFTSGLVTFVIQNNHDITVNQDIDVMEIQVGQGTNGKLIVGNDATVRTINIRSKLDVKATGQFYAATLAMHVLNLYGDLYNAGTINFKNAGQNINTNFFSTTGKIFGASTSKFNDVTFKAASNTTANVDLNIDGNVVFEAGAIYQDGGFTTYVEGNWTQAALLQMTPATGSVIFNGNGCSITATATFNNLSFIGASGNINAATVVNGNFEVNSTFLTPNQNVTVAKDFSIINGATYNQTLGGTTTLNGVTAQAMLITGTGRFYNLTFSNGAALAKTITGNVNVANVMTINAGATIADAANDHIVSNGLTLNGTCNLSGSLDLRGGNLTSANLTAAMPNLVDMIISTGTVYLTPTGASLALTVGGNVSQNSGQFVINPNATLSGDGDGTFSVNGAYNLYLRGSDNFPTLFLSYSLHPTSITRYDADLDQTIRGCSGWEYGNLYVFNTYNANPHTKTADGALIVRGDLDFGVTTTSTKLKCDYDITVSGNIARAFAAGTTASIEQVGNYTLFLNSNANQIVSAGRYDLNNISLSADVTSSAYYKRFTAPVDLRLTGNYTATCAGGSSSQLMEIQMQTNGVAGTPVNFSLGEYCQLNSTAATFGVDFFDKFSGNIDFDVNSNMLYSANVATIADKNCALCATSTFAYGNLMLGGNGDKTAEGEIDINGHFSVNGGAPIFIAGNYTHTIAKDWLVPGGNATLASMNGSTINFDGVYQKINATNFYNLQVSSSTEAYLNGDINVYGDVIIDALKTFNAGSTTAYDINIYGNWNSAGIFKHTSPTGRVTFRSTTQNQTITSNASNVFGNLYITKNNGVGNQTVTLLSGVRVGGNLFMTRDQSILDISNQTLTFSGLRFDYYDNTHIVTPSFITTNSLVIFDGFNAQRIFQASILPMPFNNVQFSGANKAFEYFNDIPIASRIIDIDGDVEINGCTVDGDGWGNGGVNFTVAGDWIVNGGGFVNSNARTVTFDGGNQRVDGAGFGNFFHLVFAGTDTKTLFGNLNLLGNLTINPASTLDVNVANYSITMAGIWTNNGSFNAQNGTVKFNGANGTNPNIVTGGSAATKAFWNIEISQTGGVRYLGGDIDINNDFLITQGAFDNRTYNVNIGGNLENLGTFTHLNNGTRITFDATAGTKIFNPGVSGIAFNGITFAAPGATYDVMNDFSTNNNNDFIINNGTVNMNGKKLTFNTASQRLILNGGTFDLNAGEIIFTANNQNILNQGGTVKFVGNSGVNCKTTKTAGTYWITQTSGTFHAKYYNFDQAGTGATSALTISGGTIDAINNFSVGSFTGGTSNAGVAYLNLDNFLIDNTTNITATNVSFSSGTTNKNCKRTVVPVAPNNGYIEFQDASGNITGAANELDDLSATTGNVRWANPNGFYWDGGALTDNWEDANNWLGDVVPDSTANVYLNHDYFNPPGGYTVKIRTADAKAFRLTLDAQGGLPVALVLESGYDLKVYEKIIIGLNTTLEQADNTSMINVRNDWDNSGTYTPNGSTVTFDGYGGVFTIKTGGVGAGKSFHNLVVNSPGAATYEVRALINVDGNLTVNKGTLDLYVATNHITVGGDWLVDNTSGANFIHRNANVTFDGLAQNIQGTSQFFNFITAGSLTKTVNSTLDIAGSVTIGTGTVLDALTYSIYVSRDWIVNGTGTFEQTVPGAGIVIFNGNAGGTTQQIDNGTSAVGTAFNNIELRSASPKRFNKDCTFDGNVNISNGCGVVNLQTYTLLGNSLNSFDLGTATMQVRGANNFPSNFGSYTLAANSTVEYMADINQTIAMTNGSWAYGNLTLTDNTSPAVSVKTCLAGDLEILGNITINRRITLDMNTNSANMILTGNLDISNTGVVTDALAFIDWGTGTSKLTHVGGEWRVDADITGFNNLELSNLTGVAANKWMYSDWTLTGNLAIKDKVYLRMYTDNNYINYKRINCTGVGKVFSMETTSPNGTQIYCSTPGVVDVAFPTGFTTYTLNPNTQVILNSNSDQKVFTGNGINYANLTFNDANTTPRNTISNDGVGGAELDVDGIFDMNNCTYNDGGRNIEFGGSNFYCNYYTPSSSAVILKLDGGVDQDIRSEDWPATANILNLPTVQVSGASVKTLGDGDAVTINGNLSIAADQLCG